MQIQTLLADITVLIPISTDKVENAHAGVRRVANQFHFGRKLLDRSAEERSFLHRIKIQYKNLCVRAFVIHMLHNIDSEPLKKPCCIYWQTSIHNAIPFQPTIISFIKKIPESHDKRWESHGK